MKLPFTAEQFLKVFETYNNAVWPAQVFFYIIAVLAILAAFKTSTLSNQVISIILAFLWLWMGMVYHITYFTAINKAAYVFGILFIAQGILLFYFGAWKKDISIHFQPGLHGYAAVVLVVYALVIYPILGYWFRHVYPASPTFGLPCPTTIFTLGILLCTNRKLPLMTWIIPIAWILIGSAAAFSLGIKEDLGLLLSGIIFLILVLLKKRTPHHLKP
jgi:hypothetical protein